MKIDPKSLVYDEHFPHNPTDKQLEEYMYGFEIPFPNGDNVATFDEIRELFNQWDQSEEDEDMCYDDVHVWLLDFIGNGMHPLVSTDAQEYCRDLVANVTDGDPAADLTRDDAEQMIRNARKFDGYSIPDILTPEYFLELYNDMKPEDD